MYKSGSKTRIYIRKSIREDFLANLIKYIDENNLRISSIQKIAEKAKDSFDLIEIFE
jgi:hypothetical protein